VSDKQLDLDKHRGMAEQKATDIRRILADVEKSSGQGALRLEFIRRGAWLRPTAIIGIWLQPTCGLCPALQRELNEC
jgi:hypothetical protein